MSADNDDRIVKSGQVGVLVRPWLEQAGDTWASADAHRALTDARAIVEAARADAEAVREAARQEGAARGLAEIANLLDQAQALRAEQLRVARHDVAVLAVAVARKLIDAALLDDAGLIARLVERALNEAGEARRVRLVVAPVSSDALDEARSRLAATRPDSTLTIETDTALGPGDCRIETELGSLDARIDLQLESLLQALLAEESA